MIEVDGLTKSFGETVALAGVSFAVARGEVVGFLGLNGAGKTTTMRILASYLTPDSGGVRIDGIDVVGRAREARRKVGYLPEHPPLYLEDTVEEFLGFCAALRGLRRGRRDAAVARAVERCGLGEVRHRLIGNLSKGYRQRVGLAQALVHDPPVLILDEPTVGLDPRQIQEIRELIRGLGRDHTVLLSTHILPEVTVTCSRAVVIHQGRVLTEDSLGKPGSGDLEQAFLRLTAGETS